MQQSSLNDIDVRADGALDISTEDTRFLVELGGRVRDLRERRGMSRKVLARASQVSERYLAQLQTGTVNFWVLLRRRVASALGVRVG